MKNLHLLPTHKPSRLGYLTKRGKEVYKDLRLFDTLMPNILDSENQNIYITSDEEIKGEDWCLHEDGKGIICEVNLIFENGDLLLNNATRIKPLEFKKIILTTDQDLINDGVQAIDDEFLEWFVKNPSCEYVEVKLTKDSEDHPEIKGGYREEWEYYEIIIPKEEPNPFELSKALPDDVFYQSLEPKQETTLEEAAKHYSKDPFVCTGFLVGAKWQQNQYGLVEIELRHTKTLLASCETALEERDRQQQRSYTLEQISKEFVGEGKSGGYFDDFLDYRLESSNKITFQQWFEQFKKK